MSLIHIPTTTDIDRAAAEVAKSTGPVVFNPTELPAHLRVKSPTPRDYGITNPKFQEFTRPQLEAIELGTSLASTDIAMCLPTGVGKSLAAVCIAKRIVELYHMRVLILTHSLSLQDNTERDFESDGVATIRGRSNYGCIRNTTCEDGPFYGCRETTECPSNIAKNKALTSMIVSANYSYWLTVNRYARQQPPIGHFPFIIMDEAHMGYKLLSSHLQVTFDPIKFNDKMDRDIIDMLHKSFPELHPSPKPRQRLNQTRIEENVDMLKTWADGVLPSLNKYASTLQAEIDLCFEQGHSAPPELVTEYKAAAKFLDDARLLNSMDPQDWVVDRPHPETLRSEQYNVTATPVSPGKYNRYLFGGSDMRVYMSATLLPMCIHMLGVSNENLTFREWPRVFPSSRNPVIATPTVVIKHDTERTPFVQDRLRTTLTTISNFHEQHKGIIHSVSYDRMNGFADMLRASGLGHRLTIHERNRWGRYESAADVIARHIKRKDASILISPVMTTGVDFPDDLCRFCILPKLPFQPSQELVMKVRREKFPDLYTMETGLDLTQMTGRGSRHYFDWCVYYLLDAAWHQWFMRASARLRPMSLVVNTVMELPKDPIGFLKQKFM